MPTSLSRIRFIVLLLTPLCLGAVEWRPIEPAELAQKTPKVEANADAEVIFWDVKVEDKVSGVDFSLTLNHYIRIKIFTDRGKEKYSSVEIAQIGKRHIQDVYGRTIKPDGSTVDLKKDSIFVRDLARTKGFKARGTAFALPNVEVGDIVEYRYKEIRDNEIANYLPLSFQMDIPIWSVTYHFKPLRSEWVPWAMRTVGFHLNNTPLTRDQQGFYGTTMENVPAFKTEPYMPPEDVVRSWLLVYYEEDKRMNPEKFWKDMGRTDWNEIKPLIKVDDLVRKTAEQVTAKDSTDLEKLRSLDAFCRDNIKNVFSEEAEMTSAERKALKDNHHPSDTLKQKAGTPTDINLLFTSLATAAGYEARFARIPDRGKYFFSAEVPLRYFMRSFSVAVKVGDEWRFYDPSTPHLTPGTIRWQEEGQKALVSDPKGGFFTQTQFSPAAASAKIRKAEMKLSEDGRLEGKVEVIYTGHLAADERNRYEGMTPVQIEEDWKARLGQFGAPTVTHFEMAQKDNVSLPLIVRFEMSIPQYAARTSKRVLVEPGFFEHNCTAKFSEATRKWPVYFHYGHSEDDQVTIELPEGWTVDQPTAPVSSKIANVGDYQVKMSLTTDSRKVIYTRKFSWGNDGSLLIPAENYAGVKKVFDFIQEQDHHVLTLKRTVAVSGGLTGAAAKN